MINIKNYIKIINLHFFENIWQFGFVLLYPFLFDKVLNTNKKILIDSFIDLIKYEFEFFSNMNFEKNFNVTPYKIFFTKSFSF